MESLCERVGQMLHDDGQYLAAIDKSQKIARESLSFEAIARQLGTWPGVTRLP